MNKDISAEPFSDLLSQSQDLQIQQPFLTSRSQNICFVNLNQNKSIILNEKSVNLYENIPKASSFLNEKSKQQNENFQTNSLSNFNDMTPLDYTITIENQDLKKVQIAQQDL